jgi:DNA helicase II / ATP-dependent DNA helicase PcrA
MLSLDSDQQVVAALREGQYAVVAGPGAGKSSTLVGRYRQLVEEGVPKTDVLCLTFTKEAADSMMRKASGSPNEFSTFHALGYRICRMEKGNQQLEPEIRHRLLAKLSMKYGLDYKEIANYISKCRRGGISPAQAMEETGEWKYGFPRAYNEYETERIKGGWLDFDSLLADSLDLLQNPEVRARWSWKFIMVDEAQDCEPCQYSIVRLISEKWNNVLFVGDKQQAVYGFRQAVVDFESLMRSIWPETKTYYLGRNYRSHHLIVNYLKQKSPTSGPIAEKMFSARPDIGVPIEYKVFANELDEAEDTLVRAAENPKESAVLARTNRGLAHIENLCIQYNIRYTLLGTSGFWKQTEVHRAIEALKKHLSTPLPTAIAIVRHQLEQKYRVDDATKEDNEALENLQILRSIAAKFTTTQDFVVFANRCMHAKHTAKGVTLGTVHQAKGCEWRNVFLIGCRDGQMPHAKSLDIMEEKRIFFVAVSRAIDYLRISWSGPQSMYTRPEVSADVLAALQEKMGEVRRLWKKDSPQNGNG